MKIFHKILLAASISSIFPLFLMCIFLIQFERRHVEANLLQMATLPVEYIKVLPNIEKPIFDIEFNKQTGEIISSNIELTNVYKSLLVQKRNVENIGKKPLLVKFYQNGQIYKGICQNSSSEDFARCRLINMLLLGSDISAFTDTLIVIILLSTTVVLIAVFIVSRVLSKPLEMVSDYLNVLPEQDFQYELKVFSNDELGVLTKRLKLYSEKLLYYKDELIKQNKLAAIGQTTAMIAHDIRRPFSNMRMFLSQLPERKNDEEFIRQSVENLESSLAQADDMLEQTLYLGRKMELKCDVCSPEVVINNSVKGLSLHRAADVKLEYDFRNSSHYYVDVSKITRAFNNIISNAVDAMEGSGTIKIAVSDEFVDGKKFIKTTIYNDGPIIGADVIDKLFDPFFSFGKEKGTGLGLSICKKIIEEHGGQISAASDEENGTQFIFTLPAVEKKEGYKRGIPTSPRLRWAGKHEDDTKNKLGNDRKNRHLIVVIDDDELSIQHARRLIKECETEKNGYDIESFSSGEEALQFIEGNREVKFVLVDYNLGNGRKNGVEIIRDVKEISPEAKILLMSNYCPAEERLAALQSGASAFAPKPIARGDIINLQGVGAGEFV